MGFSTSTLGNIALFSQSAGLGLNTAGAYGASRAQQASLRGEAVTLDANSRIAMLASESALMAGQRQSGQLAFRQGQLRGTQRAAQAANNIDLSAPGSAAEVRASSDVMSQIDRNEIEAQALGQAWGYRVQATNYENAARTARASARGINPYLNAGTSLIGGAGQVASTWYQLGNR